MDHFHHIYSHRAADYHRLIVPEDADGNLLTAIRRVTDIHGKRVLDLGTGTGRLPLLLAREAARLVGLDLHRDMLRQNAVERAAADGRWALVQGDMSGLPFPSAAFDVVTAGWAIGHLTGWYPNDWREHIGAVLREMQRVAGPSGALLIMETLTTGSLTPAPPTAGLAEYYARLENDWGFVRQQIRTDYQFADAEDAVAHTEFFFGSEMSDKIRAHGWARLPEWTGVWSKSIT